MFNSIVGLTFWHLFAFFRYLLPVFSVTYPAMLPQILTISSRNKFKNLTKPICRTHLKFGEFELLTYEQCANPQSHGMLLPHCKNSNYS